LCLFLYNVSYIPKEVDALLEDVPKPVAALLGLIVVEGKGKGDDLRKDTSIKTSSMIRFSHAMTCLMAYHNQKRTFDKLNLIFTI